MSNSTTQPGVLKRAAIVISIAVMIVLAVRTATAAVLNLRLLRSYEAASHWWVMPDLSAYHAEDVIHFYLLGVIAITGLIAAITLTAVIVGGLFLYIKGGSVSSKKDEGGLG